MKMKFPPTGGCRLSFFTDYCNTLYNCADKGKEVSYFSCVVFLSIVVNHVADSNPYLFLWNRLLDTIIGSIIGITVNSFSLPRERKKDVLFISEMDETLSEQKENRNGYSREELNRMLDNGTNFTLSTFRTPASIMEGIRDFLFEIQTDSGYGKETGGSLFYEYGYG